MGIKDMFEGAVKKGQDSVSSSVEALQKQNDTIIDNMNEMIMLLKKICDKLEVEADVEREE